MLSMLSIPVYIRLLGVAEWGVVAACVSLQIISNFIDAGFSQIFPRWIARAAHSPQMLAQYMSLFRRISVALGLLMFGLIQASAEFLAEQWFQVPDSVSAGLELAIRIMSFQFLFQFLNNLHISFWHGLQRQVLANVRTCVFGTLKHGVAIALLILAAPQASLYAFAFAMVALAELCSNAFKVHYMLKKVPAATIAEARLLGPLFKEVSVLSSGILVGLLVSQLDRIVLSRTVDLNLYGVYVVVITLALAFLQLQIPLSRAYLPLLAQDFQTTGRVSLVHLKKLFLGTVFFATIPALLTCFFAPQVLTLWLHDPYIVKVGSDPLRVLLVAIALNTVYGVIYQAMVSMGEAYMVLYINITCLVVAGLVVVLIPPPGLMLGATIWLSCSITQLVVGVIWLFKKKSNPLIR